MPNADCESPLLLLLLAPMAGKRKKQKTPTATKEHPRSVQSQQRGSSYLETHNAEARVTASATEETSDRNMPGYAHYPPPALLFPPKRREDKTPFG